MITQNKSYRSSNTEQVALHSPLEERHYLLVGSVDCRLPIAALGRLISCTSLLKGRRIFSCRQKAATSTLLWGAKAVATVSQAKKAGMMGKGGDLNVRLEYLRSDSGKIKLRGTKNREGDGKVGATVALTILFGPIGLIKHGKNVEVKKGTLLTAHVADDMPIPNGK